MKNEQLCGLLSCNGGCYFLDSKLFLIVLFVFITKYSSTVMQNPSRENQWTQVTQGNGTYVWLNEWFGR